LPARPDALVDAVSLRFAPAGSYARHYARGKLRHDPIFFWLLAHGAIPDRARLLDLGCGQGILLALLAEAQRAVAWPGGWPRPPEAPLLRGIERSAGEVRCARLALGADATIEEADLREVPLPQSDVIALVDVVHYLEPAAQERLLAAAAGALAPGGVLWLRSCDAAAGVSAWLTRLGDHVGTLSKLGRIAPHHVRSAAEWSGLLERLGLSVSARPMAFANVLFSARKPG